MTNYSVTKEFKGAATVTRANNMLGRINPFLLSNLLRDDDQPSRLMATHVMSSACASPCAKLSTAEKRLETRSIVVEVRLFNSVSRRRESPNSSFRGLTASVIPSVNKIQNFPVSWSGLTQEKAQGLAEGFNPR